MDGTKDVADIIGEIDEDMPLEIMEHAQAAVIETMPVKSKEKYNRVYKLFKDWQLGHGVSNISSDLIMAYFHVLHGKNYKPTSLWAFHSMLKSTLRAYENIDIGKFYAVTSYLKTKSSGYKCIKAKIFKEAEIQKFISEADDQAWLDVKVVLIFGICGACRTDELTRITMDDVQRHGDIFVVMLQQTKTKVSGSFTINGGFATVVQKYIDLRPTRVESRDRFFVNYQRGKCTVQFVGKNKLSKMPRRIAEYLHLVEAERYTGHAFRRTSATILANNGADLETIMRHGRWRNGSCARGYIEESIQYKAKTGQMIQCSVMGSVSSSFAQTLTVAPTSTFAVTSAQGNATSASVVATSDSSSAGSTDNGDSLFESSIEDADLIELVNRASQAYEVERSSIRESDEIVPKKRRKESGNVVINQVRDTDDVDDDAMFHSLDNLTQKKDSAEMIESNSDLSMETILARSFKNVKFGRMDKCTFNLYFANTK